jgi:gluconolactonase
LDATGEVTVVWADAGTNGLALDAAGRLLSANHRTGGITVVPLGEEAEANVVDTYDGVRLNSPNDLTVGRDGTLYFTDPDYQAPRPAPQPQTRAYRVAPGTNVAVPMIEERRQPNGITLSPDGGTLYVSASDGLVAYPVLPDGSIGDGEVFAEGVVRSSDGMAVDCAGNLYTTSGQSVIIVDPAGVEVARIVVPDVQSVTNVAFGGPESKTIYLTTLGSGSRVGLFRLTAAVPGMPY